MDPLAQLDGYLEKLQAAGIRATTDPRNVNPPAVLLRPPTLHYRFGRGCQGAEWTAQLVLPNPGVREALEVALPLLQQIQDALVGAVVTAAPIDVELADGGGPTPGYQLTWATR